MSSRYCKCGLRFKDRHQKALSRWLPYQGVLFQLHERTCRNCDYVIQVWIKTKSIPEDNEVVVGQVIWLES